MNRQEKELLEGYRQLRPESKRLIMATVITAVTKEMTIKRQYGESRNLLMETNNPANSGKKYMNSRKRG